MRRRDLPEQEKLSEQIALRLTRSDMNILVNIASASCCNESSIIRRALAEFFAKNGFLSEERKKWILP